MAKGWRKRLDPGQIQIFEIDATTKGDTREVSRELARFVIADNTCARKDKQDHPAVQGCNIASTKDGGSGLQERRCHRCPMKNHRLLP